MNVLIDSDRESPRRSETKVVGIDIGGTEIQMAAFSATSELLFRPLNDSLNEMEWHPAGHRVRIVPAALGEWAGTFAAAWNALHSTPV